MTFQSLAMPTNTKTIDFSKAKEIAAGGEGRIVEHPLNKKKVVKLYHIPRKAEFAKHLKALSGLSNKFVKPGEIFYNARGEVIGFEMDYVNFNNYWLFNNSFNKGFCSNNNIDKAFKIKILSELRAGIEELHKNKIVVGDLNQYNLFISKKGEILFVDVDSYSTSTNPHNGVLLDDIRDWTTMNINEQTDAWAFDILSFWVTTFCHPFKWVVPGNKESLEQRVKSNKSYLNKISGMKLPALYEPPIGELAKQFLEIFHGRRYMVNLSGIHVPVSTVVKQQVSSTSLTIRELFTGITAMNVCDSFIAVRTNKGKWVLVEAKIAKITRQILEFDCDYLFPSNSGMYATVTNNKLSDKNGMSSNTKTFGQPEFFFNNGYLSVIDYISDIQWNFNLNNQLAGIDNTQTPVFAKSILIRQSPIQNFGKKKYLNIPMNNSYTMIEVPDGTKDAIYSKNHVCVEYKEKSQVKYLLFNISTKESIDLDYLAHFAEKNKMLFVPENGKIDIYQGYSKVAELDVSICTRDSKLYDTTSGLILFENNSIYLLNTK